MPRPVMIGKLKWGFRKGGLKSLFMKDILEQINNKIKNNKAAIRDKIREEVYNTIIRSDTAQALKQGGELAAEFGIPIGENDARIHSIADRVATNCNITFPQIRNNKTGIAMHGGIRIKFIVDDYSDILGLPMGEVKTEKGDILTWLSWLLLEGSSIAIQLPNPGTDKNGNQNEYYIHYKKAGRSGSAIMLKSKKGIGWRVPSQFAGTENDNWLTRLFSGISGDAFNLRIRTIVEGFTVGP